MGQEYVEVRANSAMLLDGDPSSGSQGGWETEGKHVNWDSNSGFIGTGWYIGQLVEQLYQGNVIFAHGPLYSKTLEEIQSEIAKNNDLDDSFNEWARTYTLDERSAWVMYLESHTPGCVESIA